MPIGHEIPTAPRAIFIAPWHRLRLLTKRRAMTGLSPHEFVGRSGLNAHLEPTVRILSGAQCAQGGWYREICSTAGLVPPELFSWRFFYVV